MHNGVFKSTSTSTEEIVFRNMESCLPIRSDTSRIVHEWGSLPLKSYIHIVIRTIIKCQSWCFVSRSMQWDPKQCRNRHTNSSVISVFSMRFNFNTVYQPNQYLEMAPVKEFGPKTTAHEVAAHFKNQIVGKTGTAKSHILDPLQFILLILLSPYHRCSRGWTGCRIGLFARCLPASRPHSFSP